MPVVLLPGTDVPTTLPVAKLKAEVDAGKRVVLPDNDVALSKKDGEYLVEPLDADYVEEQTMDATVDNSAYAEHFQSFEEAFESVE